MRKINRIKSTLCLLLCAALTLAAFAGCSGKSAGSKTAGEYAALLTSASGLRDYDISVEAELAHGDALADMLLEAEIRSAASRAGIYAASSDGYGETAALDAVIDGSALYIASDAGYRMTTVADYTGDDSLAGFADLESKAISLSEMMTEVLVRIADKLDAVTCENGVYTLDIDHDKAYDAMTTACAFLAENDIYAAYADTMTALAAVFGHDALTQDELRSIGNGTYVNESGAPTFADQFGAFRHTIAASGSAYELSLTMEYGSATLDATVTLKPDTADVAIPGNIIEPDDLESPAESDETEAPDGNETEKAAAALAALSATLETDEERCFETFRQLDGSDADTLRQSIVEVLPSALSVGVDTGAEDRISGEFSDAAAAQSAAIDGPGVVVRYAVETGGDTPAHLVQIVFGWYAGVEISGYDTLARTLANFGYHVDEETLRALIRYLDENVTALSEQNGDVFTQTETLMTDNSEITLEAFVTQGFYCEIALAETD